MKEYKLPSPVMKTIKSYFELNFGSKRIRAPYHMNLKKEKGGLRVMIGKGTAEEIIHEAKVWAQLKGIKLGRKSENEIREFLINRGIGIDCSGFIVHALNTWFIYLGKGSIWKNLKYKNNSITSKIRRFFRPIENVGANILTSSLNCTKVTDLNGVKPGDLIRAKGKQKNSHHVALITKVTKAEDEKTKKFEYVHSHRFYENQNGVRKGTVMIINDKKGLKDQKWEDDYKGRNYMLEDLLIDYNDNGIRRLKALSN